MKSMIEARIPISAGSPAAARFLVLVFFGAGLLPGQNALQPNPGAASTRMKPGLLRAELEFSVEAHGDRMLKPGKERMVLAGTITRPASGSEPFQLVRQLPDLTRLDVQGAGTGAPAIGFDGSAPWTTAGRFEAGDSGLIESLVYDTPERFFFMQAQGVPARKLGANFRMDGKTGTPYSGPCYDIYLAVDSVRTANGTKLQPKYYLVNSSTLLLERIQYRDASAGNVSIETVISDWLTVNGNRVPKTILRLEKGVEVLRLTVNSAAFGPAATDGAFRGN